MSRYWLLKTEPSVFSFQDLQAAPNQTTGWEGVRNYQARNFMRDEFKLGDLVFIYHSAVKEPAIMGTAEVVREAYDDVTALDPKSKYFDDKSQKAGKSRWVQVDVQARKLFPKPVTLQQCREQSSLSDMALLQKGQRLSIQPVTKSQWVKICKLGGV